MTRSVDVRIEAMTAADWPQVRAIYIEGINSGKATFETTAPSYEDWDKRHLPHSRLVARCGDEIAGWVALSPVSSRKAYAGVAEPSMYVADKFQGKGIGATLQAALIKESEANGIWTLQSVVFPENRASLALLEKGGFRVVGRRERIAKLNGVWRDTILLERRSPKIE